jgi:hypothetical protein
MRIENTSLNAPQLQDAAPQAAPTAASTLTTANPGVTDSSVYIPSPDLARLTALARQEPEVRPDRLREVAANLRSGAYLTADSAQRTAQALRAAVD